MPRRVSYRLQWSEEVRAYELYDENTLRQLTFDGRGSPAGDHKGPPSHSSSPLPLQEGYFLLFLSKPVRGVLHGAQGEDAAR